MAAALDLLAAAIVGDEAAVRQMLAADQQIAAATHSPDDVTALHYAAYYDKCGVTQLLLAAAPKNISSRTFPGLTPLHCAAVNGASAVVQLLVEADPAGAFVVDKHGNTPLLAALAGLRQKGRRRESFLASACCLVQAAQTVQPALDTLNRYQPDLNSAAASLYADLASHLPLADAQWQLVPAPALPWHMRCRLSRSDPLPRLAGWWGAWLRTSAPACAPQPSAWPGFSTTCSERLVCPPIQRILVLALQD